jgi:hypothetical protein
LAAALSLAVEVDDAIRDSLTEEVMDVRGVEFDSTSVVLPGELRLHEDLSLARRDHAAIFHLMLRTASPESDDDLTEPAAVILRRLQELLLQVVWVSGVPSPDDLSFPVDVGDPDVVLSAAAADWEDRANFKQFVGYLIHSTTWEDVQALRSELSEIRQKRLVERQAIEWGATDRATHESTLKILEDRREMIKARLSEMGAPDTERQGNTDIARNYMQPAVVMAYRMESDTAHAGETARRYQRGPEDDPGLGSPSPPYRRALVMVSANAILLELAASVVTALGGDPALLNEVAAKHIEDLPD